MPRSISSSHRSLEWLPFSRSKAPGLPCILLGENDCQGGEQPLAAGFQMSRDGDSACALLAFWRTSLGWLMKAGHHCTSAEARLGGFRGNAKIFLLARRNVKETCGSNSAGASLRWEMGQCCLLVELGLCSGAWCWLQGPVSLFHGNGAVGVLLSTPCIQVSSPIFLFDLAAWVSFPVSVAPLQAQHSKESEKGGSSLWMLWNDLTS